MSSIQNASSNGLATKSVAVYSSVRVASRSEQEVITIMGTSQHKRTKIDRQCCNAMRCGRTDPFYKETQDAGRRARSRQGVESNVPLVLCLCLWHFLPLELGAGAAQAREGGVLYQCGRVAFRCSTPQSSYR